MVNTAFVLVGGLGTRLSPVVSDIPKAMAPVAGRPFLEHLLDYLLTQGVENIVLCVGHLRNVIEDHFKTSYKGLSISYSFEEVPSGTGGALSRALQDFPPKGMFLACNGDTFFPIDTSRLENSARENSWAIATFPARDLERYGALHIGLDGALLDMPVQSGRGRPTGAIRTQANSGVWIGNPRKVVLPLLASESSYSLEQYLARALREGTASAVAQEFDSPFIDIGLPKDFFRAQTLPAFVGT